MQACLYEVEESKLLLPCWNLRYQVHFCSVGGCGWSRERERERLRDDDDDLLRGGGGVRRQEYASWRNFAKKKKKRCCII